MSLPTGGSFGSNIPAPDSSSAYGQRGVGRQEPTVGWTREDGTNIYESRTEYNERRLQRPKYNIKDPGERISEAELRGHPPSREVPYNRAPPTPHDTSRGVRNRYRPIRPRPSTSQAETNFGGTPQDGARRVSVQEYSQRFTPDTRIPIEPVDIAETTPLLGSAAAVGNTGAAIGTVVGGLGLAAGAGYLANKISRDGAVLPGSEYIGPGNPIREGPARHPADQIARDHDIGYETALREAKAKGFTKKQFEEEISKLDNKAWNSFYNRWRNDGDWRALVGYLGLRIKAGVEGKTGVLYPSFTGELWVRDKDRWVRILPRDQIGIE